MIIVDWLAALMILAALGAAAKLALSAWQWLRLARFASNIKAAQGMAHIAVRAVEVESRKNDKLRGKLKLIAARARVSEWLENAGVHLGQPLLSDIVEAAVWEMGGG